MKPANFPSRSVAVLVLLGVVGCSPSDQTELQQWMTDQRSAIRPKVEPLPEPGKFSPQPYNQEGGIEPFSNQKLTQALKRDSNQATGARSHWKVPRWMPLSWSAA